MEILPGTFLEYKEEIKFLFCVSQFFIRTIFLKKKKKRELTFFINFFLLNIKTKIPELNHKTIFRYFAEGSKRKPDFSPSFSSPSDRRKSSKPEFKEELDGKNEVKIFEKNQSFLTI